MVKTTETQGVYDCMLHYVASNGADGAAEIPPESGSKDAGKLAGSAQKGAGKARLLTFEDMDARTRARRRADEMLKGLIDDLGAEALSRADLMRVRQCVFMDAVIEDMHVRALKDGGKIDRASLATLVNTCSRNLEAVTARSADRKPRPVTLDEACTRDLARTILDIFRQAELAPTDEPTGELPAPTAIEPHVSDTGPSGLASAPEREVFDNGATIELTEIVPARMQPGANGSQREAPAIRKWHVFDASGALHGCRVRREDAVALAESLPRVPGGSGAARVLHRV